jgi:hypothetical protein
MLRSLLVVFVLAAPLAAGPALAQRAPDKPAYKLGERLSAQPRPAAAKYRQIAWEELIPKDWDPLKDLRGMDLNALQDGDPKAIRALEKLRESWDNAPTNPKMDGEAIRLPGFLVPLDDSTALREFLLVPYFGACIHSPPPPSNQIIHVVLAKPLTGFRTMDAVWVSGPISVRRGDSRYGASGYRLEAAAVEAYREDQRKR